MPRWEGAPWVKTINNAVRRELFMIFPFLFDILYTVMYFPCIFSKITQIPIKGVFVGIL